MANYPSGIGLSINTAVILELKDETPRNTVISAPNISFGYVRQLGLLAYSAMLDDYVQYRTEGTWQFQQSGITYAFVDDSNILFVQDAILPP